MKRFVAAALLIVALGLCFTAHTLAMRVIMPACNDEFPSTLQACDLKGPVHAANTADSATDEQTSYLGFMAFSRDGKLTEMRFERGAVRRDTVFTSDDGGLTVKKHRLESDATNSYDELWILSFDAEGHETKLQQRGPDGKFWTNIEQEFDSSGHILTSTSHLALNDGSYQRKDYKYDAQGRLTETQTLWGLSGQAGSPILYDYPAPNIERKREFTADRFPVGDAASETLTRTTLTTRDDAGRPVEVAITGEACEDCDAPGRVTTRYDTHGNLLEEIHYSPRGEVETLETRRYEEHGQLLEKILSSESGQLQSREMDNYSKNGALLSKTETHRVREGMMTTQSEYEVDGHGNVTHLEEKITTPDGKETVHVRSTNYTYYDE